MSFFSLMMESIWTFGDGDEWYRSELEPKSPGATLVTFFSFLVIYNYVIPISLYVTVEMNRFISAFFISWDDHFHYRLADGEELQETVFRLILRYGTNRDWCGFSKISQDLEPVLMEHVKMKNSEDFQLQTDYVFQSNSF